MDQPEVFYRYVDVNGTVMLEKHRVIKRTPCGVWLHRPYTKDEKKFVRLQDFSGDQTHKRWACPTVEDAKVSFLKRKSRQLRLLRAQIACVEEAVENMQSGNLAGDNYFQFSEFD